ncbi:hypothetical protein WMY93_024291 [Mugilogobius chulae]|uniref:UPAR/Ly6 domain-containing protein n=1 Tax=Mugilogobius chulae TaxID=88201 RepID=A0AAW0MZ69_9GOBI
MFMKNYNIHQRTTKHAPLTVTETAWYTCYSCTPLDKQPCTKTVDCNTLGDFFNRCYITSVFGAVTQGCMRSELCIKPINCCEGHLCNSAPLALAPPPVLLMSLCVAALTLFL